tara:strand:+ start:148 stop:690 length:543 start_codon:yes stop_codon:yes gene_type:complete
MTLASFITISRVVLIIPIMYLIITPSFWANIFALILFLIAAVTDYLDGYIARKTSTESSLGALLDLLADKLLVCLVLIWFVYVNQKTALIIPVLLIISRELIISALRQYIVELVGKNKVKVSIIGKSKTTIQFIAISLLIISPNLGNYFEFISNTFVWIAAIASIISLYSYLKEWKKFLR